MKKIALCFILVSLLCLISALFMGNIAALQFAFPGFFEMLPFLKSRTLHVALVVAWIFSAAVGGVYYYLYLNMANKVSVKLARIHLLLFVITGLIILIHYCFGRFGGREYWEFPPYLSIPIIIAWLFFLVNYFRATIKSIRTWPVYYWMWGTGILFFLITFLEANLWQIPYFSENVVREITIQWKAYGALVGSWNMLIYGTAIYLMERIKGTRELGTSKTTFLLFFLGLTNLMFGWAHHTYPVPSAPWIRNLAYLISMTELIILARIIWNWHHTISDAAKFNSQISYLLMLASEVWILLNLILAILISIPAINLFTHGTHITVAHSMGSTIGINTMILLASVFFMLSHASKRPIGARILKKAVLVANIALLGFWVCLLMAGTTRMQYQSTGTGSFQEGTDLVIPYIIGLSICGWLLFISMAILVWRALVICVRLIRPRRN